MTQGSGWRVSVEEVRQLDGYGSSCLKVSMQRESTESHKRDGPKGARIKSTRDGRLKRGGEYFNQSYQRINSSRNV